MGELLTAEDLQKIEGLCEKATPGLIASVLGTGGPGDCNGEPETSLTKMKEHLSWLAGASDKRDDSDQFLWEVTAPDPEDQNEIVCAAVTGNGPTSEANARFFASAPANILRLVSEVKKVTAHADKLADELKSMIELLEGYTKTPHAEIFDAKDELAGWEKAKDG